MAARTAQHVRLDPQALEARTQEIGRELFASAKREHANLSALNRWTAQVLSWCLADPAVKASVLRFIDVLPSLREPREIAGHVREYFPTTALRLPGALRLGSSLARTGLLTASALSAVVHQLVQQVARQFIAEGGSDGARRVIQQVTAQKASCSFDVLGEQVLSEAEADAYVGQYHTVLEEAVSAYGLIPTASLPLVCGPLINLSVKPSAMSPRFDPISPRQSIERVAQRLVPLFQSAAEHGALITLDMEQYELRGLTLELAQHLLLHRDIDRRASLGIVMQAYLRDAEAALEELLEWLMAHELTIAIRLVKGAYWDYEVAQAQSRHWPAPVYEEKAATDLAFERMTERLLRAQPLVTTAIASHNLRSIAHAMAAAEWLGLERHQLEFQLLYGMGDAIQAAITARGYPVRIYTPVGALIPGMGYLVRRILENTANESFLRQDFLHEHSAEELLQPLRPAGKAGVPRVEREPGSTIEWVPTPPVDFAQTPAGAQMTRALAAVRAHGGQEYPLVLAGGKMMRAQRLIVRNPADPNELVGLVAQATPADVDLAIERAQHAQEAWARVSVRERVACLRRAATLLRQERAELAALEVLEVGKTWREADLDVVEALDYLEYYSARMLELSRGRRLVQLPGERNTYVYRPRGVTAVISPWNFPLAIPTGMASAALVAGNAVILKPAEQSPITAYHLVRILREAGVPPGVVQYLPGSGETVGAALVRHSRVAQILFTGSRAVGLGIVEAASTVPPGQRFIKHVVAELGGKNAIIVDADADLDAAIAGTLISAFGYAGQKCSAASRLIVHEKVYDRALSRLVAAADRLVVGSPDDPQTDIGPLIEEAAQRRLTEAAVYARSVARVAYEYPRSRLSERGYFVGPTIVTEVSGQDRLAREELFGPLLCVFRVKEFEEALVLANETDYALTGGVYSRSPSHLALAAEQFDVGNLYFNRPVTGALVGRQPFGGHRLSGLGTKAGGPDYLLQLVVPKAIAENTARHGMPLDVPER